MNDEAKGRSPGNWASGTPGWPRALIIAVIVIVLVAAAVLPRLIHSPRPALQGVPTVQVGASAAAQAGSAASP